MRTGLLAYKLGMSTLYQADGTAIPVTLLQVKDCHVVSTKTKEKDGYNAVQVGVGVAKIKNVSKSMKGHFSKNSVFPKMKIKEFRVSEKALLESSLEIRADHFVEGQYVDVTSNTIGKGFAGGMKRWNFGGLRASHGVSVSHRSHGSTGQCQDPGKVFKGKKMAGHLGCERVTIQNLKVVRVDVEHGLLIIKGAIPGHKGSYIEVKDAIKRALPGSAPFPARDNMVKDSLQMNEIILEVNDKGSMSNEN